MNRSRPHTLRNNARGASTACSDKTFVEFFAGIGLVDEGLRPSGWECIYANDIDPRKREIHSTRHPNARYYHLDDIGDTEKVVAKIPGRPFLATASFPCIDLSLAGHYRGFEGEHSSTFFGFAKVLDRLEKRRPKLVMLENVLGFLTARNGQDFRTAVTILAELGYWLDAFVLNAGHFVPQSRPRVFVIGIACDMVPSLTARRLLREFHPLPPISGLRPESIARASQSFSLPTGWAILDLPVPPQRKLRLEDVIDLDDEQDWWDEHQVQRHYRMMSDRHRRQIDLILTSKSKFIGTVFRRVRQDGQRAEVRFDGLAGCLRTPRGGSGRQIVVAIQNGKLRIRWMSAREYSRLQGVPNYPLRCPNNQLLLGFGDAVCVPAISWIDRHALTPIYESSLTGSKNGHARQSYSRAT